MSDLFNKGLPKWPQMLTTGKKVTEDQAKEIIRRTDSFLTGGFGGNDANWNRVMAKRMRMPHFHDFGEDYKNVDWNERHAKTRVWMERWKAIDCEYVRNSWLSCAYIFGPYGWCWPDGTISYVDNVGKHPSVKSIHKDWSTLAREFPFLELVATLMDGEHCEESAPVVTLLVKGGEVQVVEGSKRHHDSYPLPRGRDESLAIRAIGTMSPQQREHYPIRDEWYDEWEKLAIEIDEAPLCLGG